eukprot:5148728-Ditylum_brightwellii.AAC.2
MDFQPGGIATIPTDKWVSYTCESGSGNIGRWLFVMIKAKKSRKVTAVSVYHVCNSSLDQAGPST